MDDNDENLNLTGLQEDWDNECGKVCTDEIVDDNLQNLLRNHKVHELAITMINKVHELFIKKRDLNNVDERNSKWDHNHVDLRVSEKCYIFLIKFVRDNQ